jgi:hypothetical protein
MPVKNFPLGILVLVYVVGASGLMTTLVGFGAASFLVPVGFFGFVFF